MTDRKQERATERPKQHDREQPPTWRNTRPRGNQELHERDHARSVERFEAVLGASVARVLALLYDVHGNLPALEAVLEDAGRRRGRASCWAATTRSFGAWPAETVERLRELDARAGSAATPSAGPLDPSDAPEPVRPRHSSAAASCSATSWRAELAALPRAAERRRRPLLPRARRVSDVSSFLPEPATRTRSCWRARDRAVLVFGHTHLPFARSGPGGIELVNPGSVGHAVRRRHRAPPTRCCTTTARVELRRVEYDRRASAAAVRERSARRGSSPSRRRLEQAPLRRRRSPPP